MLRNHSSAGPSWNNCCWHAFIVFDKDSYSYVDNCLGTISGSCVALFQQALHIKKPHHAKFRPYNSRNAFPAGAAVFNIFLGCWRLFGSSRSLIICKRKNPEEK